MYPGWGVLGFLLGAVISSFGATWALRRKKGLQIVAGRSRCDACSHDLTYAETVPVLGFLALRGRCQYCEAAIDPFHLIAEVLGGSLMAAILLFRPWPWSIAEGALAITLFILALVDLKTLTLPNIGVALVTFFAALLGWQSGTLLENVVVALILGLVLIALVQGYKRLRGRTMLGTGDIKLIAALSLWLGPDIFIALALGSLLGLLHVRFAPTRPGMIAFGPSIMVGALIIGLCVRPWFTLGGLT